MCRFLAAALRAGSLLGVPAVLVTHEQIVASKAKRAGSPDVKVWVNRRSGIYHGPGTRWYGKRRSRASRASSPCDV